MYPIYVDGILVDRMGRPWVAPRPYPSIRPGGPADCARKAMIRKPDPAEAQRRTAVSKIYWAAYRAGQEAAHEAGLKRKGPPWFKRKPPKSRQWIMGEHKKPA